jgi:hypothetical protein
VDSNNLQKYLLCGLLVVALLSACCAGGTQTFRHPGADLSAITRVAVIPFDNFTTSQFAGEKVSAIYISQLLMSIDLEVVEPGEVSQVLRSNDINKNNMGQKEISLVGQKLQADTLVFGSVQEYGRERFRTENYPVISVNVRWVDVNTGTIIFTGTASAEGSPKIPVVDVGEEQLLSVLTVKVCRKLIDMVK